VSDDYECKSCHCSMDVPEGMDELDEDVRFCGPCAIAEIERLKDEGIAVLDTIERLMDAGYYFGKQDGKRWLWNADGEGVAYGETFRELCVNIVLMGL
jgi:hypothetical protein